MEKKYLSIQEYADLLSVSYNAVYKRLNKNLQPYVEVVKGHKMLKIEVLEDETLTPKFNELKKENSTNQENFTPSTSVDIDEIVRINKRNEEKIDELLKQLKEKDEQLQKQSDQIVNLSNKITELFENNQKLQLNYQLLLTADGKEQQFVNAEEEVIRNAEVVEEKPAVKKSFLKRLFNIG